MIYLSFSKRIIGILSIILCQVALGQCPSAESDWEYSQPPDAPLSLMRINEFSSYRYPGVDLLSTDMLRLVMASLNESRQEDEINLDNLFAYPSLFRASGYRRQMCATRLTEEEVVDYIEDNNFREQERANRRFGQKIIEGFVQGTLEPSVGQSIGGNPSVILGFNYNPAQGTFEEIARGSVSQGGTIPLTPDQLQRQFISLIQQYIPHEHTRSFGTLQRIVTVSERGENIVTEIHFSKIVFRKDYGRAVFRGYYEDGTKFDLYCGPDDLE